MLRHAAAGVLLALLCGAALADVPRADTNPDVELGWATPVMREIGAPPVVPGTPDSAAVLRRQPPSVFRGLEADEAGGADTRLRRAVRRAQVALWAVSPAAAPPELAAEVARVREAWKVDPSCFRDEYRAPAPGAEGRFRAAVLRDSRAAARIHFDLAEEWEELEVAGAGRGREPKRWQANYDFMRARLELQIAYVYEYQSMLGRLRKDPPLLDRATEGGWRLVRSHVMTGDPEGRKMALGAGLALTQIIHRYPGTAWEALARQARDVPLGLSWQAVK
jgi:hypothetical protein